MLILNKNRHDVGIRIRGDPVFDLLRHFEQYWMFAKNLYQKPTTDNTFFIKHFKNYDLGKLKQFKLVTSSANQNLTSYYQK